MVEDVPAANTFIADLDASGTPIAEPLPVLSELEDNSAAPSAVEAADEGGPSLAGIDSPEEDLVEQPSPLEKSFADAVAQADEASPESTAGEGDETAPLSIIEETPTGFWLREARLNDVFQHLAQLGNFQYFHNAELEGPTYIVTGQLMNDDPVRQMEELALMYGITIHTKGNTVYALNSSQLSQLPTEPFRYQLKYLRPSDIEQIKLILQPFLTPGSGIIEYESKTNTLIVLDNERKLDTLAMFLEQIDQPKQQVAIETRILRVTSSSRNRIGVDWSSVLGDPGFALDASTSLNALFNLPELDTVTKVLTSTGVGNSLAVVDNNREFTLNTTNNQANNNASLVFSPTQLSAVLRALNAGGLAQQESSPTLIAEDNEEGLISIIDRVPIITQTVTATSAGQNVSEEVRYKIDDSDPVGNPVDTREIGVTVAVTPTILPDNTIRMSLRPRSAQVVEFVPSQSGNLYPRVNESTVTTTARVPNGHSLLVGGFYEEVTSDDTNKVPVLGDIPAVNLLFKSTDKKKEHTSLVFIVTPKLYRPEDTLQHELMTHEIHDSHVLPTSHNYPDPENPGFNYEPNLGNTVSNTFKQFPEDAPANMLLPSHPYNTPRLTRSTGRTIPGFPDSTRARASRFARPKMKPSPKTVDCSEGSSGATSPTRIHEFCGSHFTRHRTRSDSRKRRSEGH